MLIAESVNHIVQFLSFKALNSLAIAKVRRAAVFSHFSVVLFLPLIGKCNAS